MTPEGGGAPDDGRGRRRADRHRAGAVARCSSRRPSSPASRASSSASSRSRSPRRRSSPASCSLTLSPALCALLFKPHVEHHAGRGSPVARRSRPSSAASTAPSTGCRPAMAALTRRLSARRVLMLVVYAGLIGLTGWQFGRAPTGFIPEQDQGYLITVLQLPPGASLARTDAVVRDAPRKILLDTPGVAHAVPFAGFDGATFTNAPNAGAIFSPLAAVRRSAPPRASRRRHILADLRSRLGRDPGRLHHHHPAAAGARHRHCRRLQDDGAGQARPRPAGARGGDAGHRGRGQPDPRPRRRLLAVQHAHAQGLCRYRPGARRDARRAGRPRVRDAAGLSRLGLRQRLQLSRPHLPGDGAGRRAVPRRHPRHRQPEDAQRQRRTWCRSARSPPSATSPGPTACRATTSIPAAEVQGSTLPGYSTGYALAAMEKLAAERLPDGFGFEWTELAYQQKLAGNTRPAGLRRLGRVRLPGAGGAIRELDACRSR